MANRNPKGKFTKGHKGFKKKGDIGLEKKAAAQAIKEIVDGRADRLLEIVDNLNDDKFLNTWLHLIEFVQPKLSRSEVKTEGDMTLSITRDVQE